MLHDLIRPAAIAGLPHGRAGAVRRRRRDPGGARLRAHRRLRALPALPAAALRLLRRHPGAVPGAGAGLGRDPRALAAALFLAVAAAFLANAGLGIYHAGVEWKFWPGPDTCAGAPQPLSTAAAACSRTSRTTRVVRCDEAPWHFLGLSFAGWNVVASAAARRRRGLRRGQGAGGAEAAPSGQESRCHPVRGRATLRRRGHADRHEHTKHQRSSGMRFIRLLCALAVAAGAPAALEAQEGGGRRR